MCSSWLDALCCLPRPPTPDDLPAESASRTQQFAESMSGPLPFSLCASVVLDNADILHIVASFLCFSPCFSGCHPKDGLDNSLLHFATCSRRTHSQLMQDGPWWRQQSLLLNMQSQLVPLHKWSCLSSDNDEVVMMVEAFGARQQEIVRRLVGDEVYEREVSPKLTEVRKVVCDRSRGLAAVGSRKREYVFSDESLSVSEDVEVYPQLTSALFDSLALFLP